MISLTAWIHSGFVGYGCGSEPPDYRYGTAFLDPSILNGGDSLYQSYYRLLFDGVSEDFLYPYFSYGGDSASIADNVGEWSRNYPGSSPAEVDSAVYGDDYRALDSLYNRMRLRRRAGLPPQLAGNSFVAGLVRRGDLETLRYILFARRCETHTGGASFWSEYRTDTLNMAQLLDLGGTERSACHSPFLKNRYAYQMVRLAHYNGHYSRAVTLYDSLMEPASASSVISYWGLGNKAGALKRLGRSPEAYYWFSRIFDEYEPRRELALREFRFKSDSEWQSTLAYARNDHERATLWMIRGLVETKFSPEPLRQMLRLEPASPRLTAMLMNEVRRVERDLYSERLTRPAMIRTRYVPEDFRWYTPQPGQAPDGYPLVHERLPSNGYAATLKGFVLEGIRGGQIHEPAFWYLAAGYLALMDRDFRQADGLLQGALRRGHAQPALLQQARLIRELVRMKSGSGAPGLNERDFTSQLQWLKSQQSQQELQWSTTRYQSALLALGQKYLVAGDVAMAVLALYKGGDRISAAKLLDFYGSQRDLRRLERIIVSRGRTSLQRTLLDSFPLGKNQMLDIRGTRLLRQGRLAESLRLFRTIPARYWEEQGAQGGGDDGTYSTFKASFSRMSDGREGTEHYGEEEQWKNYNKLSFTERIVAFEQQARRHPRRADSLRFMIANGLRSTPYWGYAGALWQGDLIHSVGLYFHSVEYPFNIKPTADRMERAEHRFLWEYGIGELPWKYYRRLALHGGNRVIAALSALQMDAIRRYPWADIHGLEQFSDSTGRRLFARRYRDLASRPEIAESIVACELP